MKKRLRSRNIAVASPEPQARGRDVNDLHVRCWCLFLRYLILMHPAFPQGKLRKAVRRLLGRQDDKAPFPAAKIPTPSEVAAFETLGIGGPSENDWSVDPTGPTVAASAWNQKAQLLLVDMLIRQRTISDNDKDISAVTLWFQQYSDRTLRTHYTRYNLGVEPSASKANRERAGVNGRRKTVSITRCSVLWCTPSLNVTVASRSSATPAIVCARSIQVLPRSEALSVVLVRDRSYTAMMRRTITPGKHVIVPSS